MFGKEGEERKNDAHVDVLGKKTAHLLSDSIPDAFLTDITLKCL